MSQASSWLRWLSKFSRMIAPQMASAEESLHITSWQRVFFHKNEPVAVRRVGCSLVISLWKIVRSWFQTNPVWCIKRTVLWSLISATEGLLNWAISHRLPVSYEAHRSPYSLVVWIPWIKVGSPASTLPRLWHPGITCTDEPWIPLGNP